MRTNSESLKQDLRKSLAGLKRLGTEIRGDLHTAGADARDQWKRFFEPQIANIEKLAKDVGAASHDAIARTSAAFGAFRASVKATQSVKVTQKKSAPRQARRSAPAKRAH